MFFAWHAACFVVAVESSVQAGVFRRLIEVASHEGANARSLWQAARVTSEVNDSARLPTAHLYDLWAVAAKQASPELAVAVSHEITMEKLGLLGFAVWTAPSCAQALHTVTRLFPLITTSGQWLPHLQDRSLVVAWVRAPSRCLGQHMSTESTLAHFVTCALQTFGPMARPTRVSVAHSMSAERRNVLRNFLDCPVDVDTGKDRLEWPREFADATPLHANVAMHEYFCTQAERVVSGLSTPHTHVHQVTTELRRRLPLGEASMEDVALALGVSLRTLRRRLAVERSSYRELVDQVRRDLAAGLLADPTTPITRVALDLGYSDGTAFSRAHRRWNGKAPKAARQHAALLGVGEGAPPVHT